MKSYTFNGTGVAIYLCLGFIPRRVRVMGNEGSGHPILEWTSSHRAAESNNGVLIEGDGTAHVLKTAGTGIEPYEGGDLLTSSNQTSTTYGEGIYLAADGAQKDFRIPYADGGDADSEIINTWTLGHSGNRTGNFNEDIHLSGVHVGEGSEICIDGKFYVIEAVTAGAGEAANEVTLKRAAPSGTVECIRGMYDLAPIALNRTTPAGIKLCMTSDINVNDEMNLIEFE